MRVAHTQLIRRTNRAYLGRPGATVILFGVRAQGILRGPAGVIQLVECQLPKLDVAGSSPVARSVTHSTEPFDEMGLPDSAGPFSSSNGAPR